ncbi:T9SS type B sorting domain-containing protein [Winogradskyella forsetii]|uniref:T9SS type B sorting domain-containing protein n=1 Tax=Winogradskyella forsetii TaxID=2686077 RepID=UPI0015BE8B52|nr:T9SS type B sorting domain-containing protein [Winogradskyella forsetii]
MHAQLGFCQGNSGDPIFTETFGTGTQNTSLPAGTTTYNYANNQNPEDGFYTVSSTSNYFDWFNINDHTPNDSNGRMLIVNSSFSDGEFYKTTINGLCENTTYEFSSWLINLTPPNGFCGAGAIPINVSFEIWDNTDTLQLASGTTGNIFGTTATAWNQYALVFQTVGQTSVILKMINNADGGCGNDLAIDDIVFKTCGDLIGTADSNTNDSVEICSTQTPYSDTITAIPDFTVFNNHFYQWQESSDGVNWSDVAGENNVSISISGITTTTYYRAKVAEFAANLDNSDCLTFSDTYQILVSPSPVAPISDGDVNFNCNSNQAILSVTAMSGITVNWYDAAVGGVLLQSDSETYTTATTGTFYAEAVDDVSGCISTTRVAVSASAVAFPDAPMSNGDVNFNCTTSEATLSVTVPNGITVNWYDMATGGILLEADSPSFVATAEGVYYAEAVNATTGCSSVTRTALTTSIVLPDAPISDGDVNLDCDTNEATVSVTVPNGISVDWFDALNAGVLLSSNSTTLIVNSPGTYYAEAKDPITGCISATRVAVNVNILTPDDASFIVTPTCDGASVNITGTIGGTFILNPTPTDGTIIDAATGEVTNGTSGESYTIEYSTLGTCSSTSEETFSVLLEDDASFTISPTCDGAVSTVTGLTGGTFSFDPVPTDGAFIDATTGLITGGVPDAIYTVVYATNGDCPSMSTQTITIPSEFELITPTPLEVCDDGTPDGITELDLSLKNAEITGSNPNYSVSYYESIADLQSGADPLPTLYTNTSNGQIIIAYVEDINTGCFDTTTLELLVQQAPVANTPTPLDFCDPDSDGFGTFDLTSKDDEITGGDTTLTVSYHETMADAQNNVNPVPSPYNNIVLGSQTLYARVESSTIATDCDTIVTLQINVNPTPQLGAVAPEPLEICDDISADGFGQFDLTSKIPEILENLADPTLYTVTFYVNETDAADALSPINNATNYTNSDDFNQVVWVRVEDMMSGCYKLTTLELIVNPIPVLVQAVPLELCDDNNPGDQEEAFTLEDAADDILNGQSGIGLAFFETQADLDANTDPISSPYTNIENPQTVFVKATNNATGCVNTSLLTLRVRPIPSPLAPMDLEVCDDDADGFTEFDLEERTTEIIGGELDIDITYHETLEDANTGSNAFASPYTNIVINEQTIYVRATNTVTGCYDISRTLTIRVLDIPQVPTTIEPFIICDMDSNGFTQFDLTTKNSEIIGAQTDVTITYHVSEADALSGNSPISTPGSYTNSSNPQTIFVRLENDNNDCFDIGSFEISVALPPEAIQPAPLEICDDETADEITVFDLTMKNDEVTGGEASWSVAYYETLANAQDEVDAVNAEAYTNTAIGTAEANPQTLVAVVTDTDTGCTDMVTLTIRVLPNPTPTASDLLPNIERCYEENTGDGEEEFDLTENEDLIRNGENGVTITYHETEDAANAGTDAIPDPTQYTNTGTPTQEIYVRMTKDATGCYALVDFTIEVNPLPEVVAVTDFIQCELFTDGTDTFDLGTKDAEVLNGQDEAQFTVSYHDNLTDAEEGMNGLVSPYTNTANPQQIFVTITNNGTGCSISTQSFNIEVQEAAQANPDMDPILFELCDDEMETDGNPVNDSTQFDLTNMDTEVLDGQDPLNYIVTYYATQEDADDKVNPLPTLYENVTNPQVIYARVDNDTPDAVTDADTSICYALAALTLQVNPLPEFDLDESYTLCVNTDGSEILDPLVIDTGLSATDYGFVWRYEGVEITGETGPSIMPTQGGSYSVLVTDISTSTATNCTNEDTTEVMESEPPSITVNVLTQNFAESHVLEVVPGDEIGDYEYSLDNGPWQDGTLFTDVSPGQHHITARDRNGCGTTTEPAFIIDYPLYFTPNGDGQNETWNIESIGSSAKIYIFDRYGKLLKQISPDGTGWDGTYNGSAMPTNGYWFTVEYDEPLTGERKEFRAHFTLKR